MTLENFKKAADDDITDGIGEGTYYYYDLVLTDIRMPTMNGFELYQKIRDRQKHQSSLLDSK